MQNRERITYVAYKWKEDFMGGDSMALAVILNNSGKYDEMVADSAFDGRVWFYFKDEEEFSRAFNPLDDEFEFVILEERN